MTVTFPIASQVPLRSAVGKVANIISDMTPAIAFIGSIIPEDLHDRSLVCNAAGNKFQFHFIRTLRRAFNSAPDVFSIQPIGSFPKSDKIWIGPTKVEMDDGVRCQLIPFVNVLFLKQLTIGLANFVFLGAWLWSRRGRPRYVLVYNVYPPMSLPVLLATRLLGGKAIAVVLDFPHNLSFKISGFRGFLQMIDVFAEAQSLSHFSGIISLTSHIAEDFAPGCPALVIEGGVDPDDANLEQESGADAVPIHDRICFYSGSLNELNGIGLLLEAFIRIKDPDYRLWIFGDGPLRPLVEKAAAGDPRIVYWGFVPNDEVVRRQRRATVLINARPSNQRIARYTFPSKLLEYMVSGRPVITTDLPGIPKEYHKFVYVLRDESPGGLAKLICEIGSKPPSELDELGRRALRFVLSNKVWAAQGKRVQEFVSTL